jgi:phosphoribosylaminoimidazolecarboxamide formyltransferase / IMP cyclohydrolase
MDKKRYALLSVSNKKGIETLARGLVDLGYSILSTGGTADAIDTAGLPVTRMKEYIGEQTIMEGRIQTLHPKIHVGILAKDKDGHFAELERMQAQPIDLVVVNLYPYEYVARDHSLSLDDAIEMLDLGGAALLRSAARNFQRVTAVCDPDDYETILWQIAKYDRVSEPLRFELAVKAFAHTAKYDAAVVSSLSEFDIETGQIPEQ